MKEKLIELILGWGGLSNCAVDFAEYLIEHGVTVPVGEVDFDYSAEDLKEMSKATEIEVKVTAKLDVDEKTALTCLHLLEVYVNKQGLVVLPHQN